MVINTSCFEKMLSQVSGAVSTNDAVPIMRCIRLECSGSNLTVSGVNAFLSIRTNLGIEEVKKGFDICIDYKTLAKIIKRFKNKSLKFKIKNRKVNISDGKLNYNLGFQEPDGFPGINDPEDDANSAEYTSGSLISSIRKVKHAVYTGSDKPVIGGILISVVGKTMNVVACDGRRAAIAQLDSNGADDSDIIIPISMADQICNSDIPDEKIVMYMMPSSLIITFSNTLIVSRIVEGQYPNYKRFFEINPPNSISIPRKEFVDTVMNATAIYDEGLSGTITLENSDDELAIVSKTDINNFNEIVEGVDLEGQDISIRANGKFILDPISNLTDKELTLQYGDTTQPVRIDEEGFTAIIMPMR